ncbi:Disease resistance protein [Corchorus olitorius]|uniref:Disease resistance protein n=1 Tax=Corchorus olitorius TaxID=93759 RepID=A0A1R3I373_9ROSI|nr:Disease resistance protein [Corchorus olitorius]
MRRQMTFIRRSLLFPKDLLARHKVAVKLQDINRRMKSITDRARQFGVQQLEERGSQRIHGPNWKNRLSESSHFFKDDDLVGINKRQHELLGWLMDEEPRRTITSVVGMGSSGKTTLVANTFNKQSVKKHFDFRTWITVSRLYAVEELLKLMVKEYKQTNKEDPMKVDNMRYKELVETLVQYLQPIKYLIVLDDVWDIQFWQEINIVLREGLRGSRVMVTTRNEDVAPSQYGFVSYVHRIQPLRREEAWELFCKRAFPDDLGRCPTHLDSILSRNLAEKCKGLPLAIVALGGFMSSKKSIAEWKKVHDNLNWELSNNTALEKKFVAVSDGEKGVEESGIRRCSMTVKGEDIQLGIDLENVPINVLPREFGKFFNLRCLNLTRTQVKVLPKSIGKLVNLQTLVLKGANVEELPCEIVKLQNLRHLSGFIYTIRKRYSSRITSIRVPPNLIKEANEEDLCSAIGRMKDLRNLHLFAPSERLNFEAGCTFISSSSSREAFSKWGNGEVHSTKSDCDLLKGSKNLEINSCKGLRGLQYGLHHLTDLKEVAFHDVSREIVKHLYEQGNIDTDSQKYRTS